MNREDIKEREERRENRRILAVCRVLNLEKQFLGFTLDLTIQGICLIISNKFEDSQEFEIIIEQNREEGKHPEIRAKIEKVWRREKNEEFDEIGAKIISVDSRENLEDLIKYCDMTAKIKYDCELVIS